METTQNDLISSDQTDRKRFGRKLWTTLGAMLLCVPLFAPTFVWIMGWDTFSDLSGSLKEKGLVALNYDSFRTGEYQDALAQALRKHLPLRGKMVRSVNQAQFSLFGKMATRSNTPLVLGKDNTLFEKSYVDSYNRLNPVPEQDIHSLVDKLLNFQTALLKHGIEFLVVVTPSKAEFYSELLPSKLVRSDRLSRLQPRLLFLERAKAANVNVLDSTTVLRKVAESSSYPIFTKGGTHWSYFGACHVSAAIVSNLSSKFGKQLGAIPCSAVTETDRARYADSDILKLANIWSHSAFRETIAYPIENMQFSWDDFHPKALVVGDSFTWMPLHYFDLHGTFIKRKFLYYFHTQYTGWIEKRKDGSPKRRKGVTRKVNRSGINWENDLFDRDVVIFFVNEHTLLNVGHGFIEAAMPQLQKPAVANAG